MVDLAHLATKPNGTGWLVRCERCESWCARLLATDGGLICRACWREMVRVEVAVERRGVKVEAKHGD